jgi:hypothetical protein
MSLLLTFMELDKLYESTMSRQNLIDHIKASGRNYNFNTKSTEQLLRMWERIQKEDSNKVNINDPELVSGITHDICAECGALLTDGGLCPICDDGEEDYYTKESLIEWIDANGNAASTSVPASTTTQPQTATSQVAKSAGKTSNIVTIVYDCQKHKFRAVANDGIHGYANVAFPNNLRTRDGQQYEVDALIWNGKNYRASGNIKPI